MQNLRNWGYKTLRRSESFFKTDMVYLAKGSFWLNSWQVLISLSSFGLAILFARFVPKEAYGNYKYILSLAGLFATFSLTGLSSAVLQSVARGFEGTFVKATKILVRWNSLIFVASMGGAIYYLSKENTVLGYGLIVVAILFPAIKVFEVYESYVNGKKDFKKSSIYRGVVDIATIATTALTLLFSENVITLIGINLATQFVLNYVFFKKIYESIPDSQRDNVEPGIIEFGKHLSLQNVLNNVAAYIDKIIIFHYLGASEVAIYIFATAIPQQIKGFLSNLTLLITPKISGRTIKEAAFMIKGRFLLSLAVIIPIVVVYILAAPIIFKVLFPAYMDAVPYTQFYALILLIMGNLSSLVLTTQKAAKEQYVLTSFASTSQIVLMLILVHSFGILGIIWAILISKFMTAVISYILVQRLARKTV